MNRPRLTAIVEGHGECEAVPVLVRRMAERIDPGLAVDISHPIRFPASKLMRPGELEKLLTLAAADLGANGANLVLVDCDDGCPAQEGPALLARARAARPDLPVAVVLAKREFEAWFLAAAESLRNRRGLPPDLEVPPDPESIRDAKGWLSRHMTGTRKYTETEDQAAMAAIFDLDAARGADSFDKCFRELDRLLRRLQAGRLAHETAEAETRPESTPPVSS